MAARTIDLNADLGEGFPSDAALLDRVTSASLACGAHAGDDRTLSVALTLAKIRGVIVGAHPGYADREGFGRRPLDLSPDEVERQIVCQVEHVSAVAQALGVRVRYVKPHGALYNQAQREEGAAGAVVRALDQLGLPLLGQPGTLLESRAREAGVRYVTEGFPDRRYLPDGRLVPRTRPDAVLHDPEEVEAQVLRLVAAGVMSLCIHGDDPRAIANADTVRALLQRHGVGLESFV